MTGVVICALFIACRSDWPCQIELAEGHAEVAGLIVVVVGFLAFIMYRMIAWQLMDGVFWIGKQSAPALYSTWSWTNPGYDNPYAEFLLWRYSKKLTEPLSGYLTYRWSVVHFMIVSSAALIASFFIAQTGSPVDEYKIYVFVAGIIFGLLALLQFWFLMRVERELCRKTK